MPILVKRIEGYDDAIFGRGKCDLCGKTIEGTCHFPIRFRNLYKKKHVAMVVVGSKLAHRHYDRGKCSYLLKRWGNKQAAKDAMKPRETDKFFLHAAGTAPTGEARRALAHLWKSHQAGVDITLGIRELFGHGMAESYSKALEIQTKGITH